jgi:hypothetical protein
MAIMVLAAIYAAGRDDQRWYRFFRRCFARRKRGLPTPAYDRRSWHRIEQDQWKRGFK